MAHFHPRSWRPAFPTPLALPGVILPLPHHVTRFLANPHFTLPPDLPTSTTIHSSDDSESWDDDDDDEPPQVTREELRSFEVVLDAAIAELGGSVVPKLEDKVPQDAAWIGMGGSVRCEMAGDVFLVLKASEAVDSLPEEAFLTLTAWDDNILPTNQFRCFVRHKKLLRKRDESGGGCHSIAGQRDSILHDIYNFFRLHVAHNFRHSDYIFDVYRPRGGLVVLLDFNVFGEPTVASLTSYEELESLYLEFEEASVGGGRGSSGLVETEAYGEPYLRYVTSREDVVPLTYRGGVPEELLE